MNVFIDTSVWSLALRRNQPAGPEVQALRRCLGGGDLVVTTGIVLQELLQGFQGPRARSLIIERLTRLPFIHPDVGDHIAAAELRNRCRRQGVQVGTIDALIAQLCIGHRLQLLTADRDFEQIAKVAPLALLGA